MLYEILLAILVFEGWLAYKYGLRAKIPMMALGGLFVVLWIYSHLGMVNIAKLSILLAACGFAYKFSLRPRAAMIALGGLFILLFVLPSLLGGNDDVEAFQPERPRIAAEPAEAGSNCVQLPGERDDAAIRAPAVDPFADRLDPAVDLLQRSATLHRWLGWAGFGSVDDYNELASLYEQQGRLQDAFNVYKESSDEGDMYGEFNVGRFYLNSKTPEKRPEAALKYFRLAAAQNLAPANYDLGVMYADGIGVKCNISEAISFWFKAGRQGSVAAIDALGLRDLGHAKLMLNHAPIDIDFANPDAVIRDEKTLISFAAGFDAKRTLPEDRRNAIIEAVRKECADRIDVIEKDVSAGRYSRYEGLQSWHGCYSSAESALF